jgi:GAF domain-containing protein
MSERIAELERTVQDKYNSESFVCTPLVFNNRLMGVLNLSNKRNGESFEAVDLECAVMLSAVLALALAGQETARRVDAMS